MPIIQPQTGSAFELKKGQRLKVIDPKGQQVSDLVAFNPYNKKEKISAGKTFDFEETILLSTSNFLWSNCSRKMLKIEEDTNGRNDFLLAPCSQETFEIMYKKAGYHPSCLNNLAENLKAFQIDKLDIPSAFNIFMNVQFSSKGRLSVLPPTSVAGDYLVFEAMMDLIIGLTACSAEDSNGGTFKPIQYEIMD